MHFLCLCGSLYHLYVQNLYHSTLAYSERDTNNIIQLMNDETLVALNRFQITFHIFNTLMDCLNAHFSASKLFKCWDPADCLFSEASCNMLVSLSVLPGSKRKLIRDCTINYHF
jgi:hypothetical protein